MWGPNWLWKKPAFRLNKTFYKSKKEINKILFMVETLSGNPNHNADDGIQ